MKLSELRSLSEERISLLKEIDKLVEDEINKLDADLRREMLVYKCLWANLPEAIAVENEYFSEEALLAITKKRARVADIKETLESQPTGKVSLVRLYKVKFDNLKASFEEYFQSKNINAKLLLHFDDLIKFGDTPVLGYRESLKLTIEDKEYLLDYVEVSKESKRQNSPTTIYLNPLFSHLPSHDWGNLFLDYPDIIEACWKAISLDMQEDKLFSISLIQRRINERQTELDNLNNPEWIARQVTSLEKSNIEDNKELNKIRDTLDDVTVE